MGFLKRLFGGGEPPDPATDATPATAQELDEEERRYERELAAFEQARTDELRQRQQRYADRAWTPPAQGGERRADDRDPRDDG
jgi:hypothetical protein